MPRILLSIGLLLALTILGGSAVAEGLPPLEKLLAERVLGKSDAPVTMIEYASLTCPHCADFHKSAYNDIKKEYVDTGKVKFILRHFPLNQLDLAATMMARCLPPERFYGTIELLFRGQESWARDRDPAGALAGVGRLAGMSQKTFEACLQNRPLVEGLMKVRNDGQQKFKIEGTPTFVVNGKKISHGNGDIANFRKILDAALSRK